MRIHFWCFLQPLFQVCFQATCLAVSSVAFILVDIVDMGERLREVNTLVLSTLVFVVRLLNI